jgi:hypothetical protein
MSEMDLTVNRLLPLLYTNLAPDTCVDNVIPEPAAPGLFDRMMQRGDEGEEDEDEEYENDDTRTVTIDANDDLHVTVVGDTGSMTFSEPLADMNETYAVGGSELLSRLSELSLEIEHDDIYTGDYVRLYELLTGLVTNM